MPRKARSHGKKTRSRAAKPHARAAGKGFADKVAKHAASIKIAEDRLAQTIRAAVARMLHQPGTVMGEWYEMAAAKTQEAMTAAQAAGGDTLSSVRGVTRGVLLGVSDAGGDSMAGASHVVKAAMSSAVEAGSQAAAVGQRALLGVVDAARNLGTDTAAAAHQAVEAVSDTVIAAGETASGLVDWLVKAARPPTGGTARKRAGARSRKKVRRKAGARKKSR